jgi:DNA-binding MarR family transcriptional regulator
MHIKLILTYSKLVDMTTNMDPKTITIEDPLGKFVNLTGRLLANRLQHNFRSSSYDITSEQWRLLIKLWIQDGQTQQELSEKTGKDKGNITRLINSLEKRNILVRIPNHVDGRSKLIYLIKQGIDCEAGLIPIVEKTLKEAQANIANEDLERCKSVLKKIIKNLSR